MSAEESKFTSYDLITDALVQEAVNNDLGPEAKVISWKTNDFTKKGDNYSSIVTSIMVNYEENGNSFEKSYVAKLNPLRPVSSFTELMQDMYARETVVLTSIVDGMNNQLHKLNLESIRTPKLYARSLVRGKEVFITENLRTQGFLMPDRKKGMDLSHALFVMKELGRFHASGFLYEETLSPKNIPESFDYFEEPWFDVTHGPFKLFNAMMSMQCKLSSEFLKKAPENYEKCSKWLDDKLDNIGQLFNESFTPAAPFDLFTHGDCWTNNMLFKYNDEGEPIDIRFVDLQCSRKTSPACELNYFYYSSLDGKGRFKNMETLEKAYFDSFLNVFKLAQKEPPYTFSEFETEMMKRKVFGLLAGMLLIPTVLAEGDEIFELDNFGEDTLDEFLSIQNSKYDRISQREGPFKDRFLSMFDEMIQYKIFDE